MRCPLPPSPLYLVPILRSAHEQLMMHINTEWENTGRLERKREAEYANGLLFCKAMPCAHGAWRRGECVCLCVSVCAGWPADSGQPNRERERGREREGERPAQSLAKAKFSILNTFHICAAPPIVVAECRCRSAI